MKKNFIKSKRFWGIALTAICKILPIIAPATAEICAQATPYSELLFGYGCLTASSPIGLKDSVAK